LFTWLVVEAGGTESRVRAIEAVTGQTILFLGVLASLFGVLVTISMGRGKHVWATLGLLVSAVVIAAAIWGIVDADGLAARFADAEAFSTIVTFTPDSSRGDVVSEAFDQGTLSARAAIGLFIGLAGGVLALLGALFSYRFTPPVAD
jgi:hypothetical protein